MSKSPEKFNPSDPKYKKVEDLPKEEQGNFINEKEGDGFVRKEAVKKLSDTERDFGNYHFSSSSAYNRYRESPNPMGVLNDEAIRYDKERTEVIDLQAHPEKYEKIKKEILDSSYRYPNGLDLSKLNKLFRADRDIVLRAIRIKGGTFIADASKELRNDPEIVLEAVSNDWNAISYASEELRNNREIVRRAMVQSGEALYKASEELRNDPEIVLQAISGVDEYNNNNAHCFTYASEELRSNREFVLKAMKRNIDILEYVPEKFRSDKELALVAVKLNGGALRFFSEKLLNDREVVLEAVKQNGMAIAYGDVPDKWRDDREVMTEAIKQNIEALKYASEEIRREIEMKIKSVL